MGNSDGRTRFVLVVAIMLLVVLSCAASLMILLDVKRKRYACQRAELLARGKLGKLNRDGVPTVLQELIDLGPEAGGYLIPLLENDTPTRIEYLGDTLYLAVKYTVHADSVDSIARRNATVSDLANFALRRIYSKDVGFRSYLPLSERRAAIKKWKDIVGER